MILEKMMAKAGCIAPLIMAQKVPTKMYGHSGMLSRSTLKKDASGTSSSCGDQDTELNSVSLVLIRTKRMDFFFFSNLCVCQPER